MTKCGCWGPSIWGQSQSNPFLMTLGIVDSWFQLKNIGIAHTSNITNTYDQHIYQHAKSVEFRLNFTYPILHLHRPRNPTFQRCSIATFVYQHNTAHTCFNIIITTIVVIIIITIISTILLVVIVITTHDYYYYIKLLLLSIL